MVWVALLCTPTQTSAQQVRGGVMAGPSWPAGGAGSGLDAGIGGEGWLGVELPGWPVMPRVAFAFARFSNDDPSGTLDMRGARLDLVAQWPEAPLNSFLFLGGGMYDSEYQAIAGSGAPVRSLDPEIGLGAGIGARIGLGPLGGVAEARYLAVTEAEFRVVQLRLGVTF